MPQMWMMFSTATSPFVARYRDRPAELRDRLAAILDSVDAELVELYFDADDEAAYAHVRDLDRDFTNIKAVTSLLDASYSKLLTVEQEERALALRRGFDEGGADAAQAV